jgi:hypothetical protein
MGHWAAGAPLHALQKLELMGFLEYVRVGNASYQEQRPTGTFHHRAVVELSRMRVPGSSPALLDAQPTTVIIAAASRISRFMGSSVG